MKKNDNKQNTPVKFRKMTGDLIGVSVLAAGVAAIIGVGYLAYARFGGESKQDENRVIAPSEEAFCQGCGEGEKAIPSQSLPAKSKLEIPTERDMEGSWQADFGTSKAFLQISKGVFQLIYVRGESGKVRKYSRGQYAYDEESGAMILRPDRSLGAPDPVKGVRYKILTRRHYGVGVFKEKNSDILYWKSELLDNDTDKHHPIFLFSNREKVAIKWEKVR